MAIQAFSDGATRDAELAALRYPAATDANASVSSPAKAPSVRALRKALRQYHPDKNRAELYGVRWAALCEEVAKLATLLLREEMSAAATPVASYDM